MVAPAKPWRPTLLWLLGVSVLSAHLRSLLCWLWLLVPNTLQPAAFSLFWYAPGLLELRMMSQAVCCH